ncbi:MAG: PIN domain-containing protein [Fusobacterium sp.]
MQDNQEFLGKRKSSDGIELPNDIFFKVEKTADISMLPEGLRKDVIDNHIIAVVMGIKKREPDRKVIFVTKDINLNKGRSLVLKWKLFTIKFL